MLRKTYENIVNGIDTRKNLIELKSQLKAKENKVALLYYIAGDYHAFYELLENEDAKIRKNTALIMGMLEVEAFMEPLYSAYEKEEKLFIKADYLAALRHFDYRVLLPKLKERLNYILTHTFEETSMKHINVEKKYLNEMILDIEGYKKHLFNGYNVISDVLLLTNRDHQEITKDEIQEGISKVFNAGVIVRTNHLEELLQIRTYSELLFRIKGVEAVSIGEVAEYLIKKGLLEFLNERHEGDFPYYFRLEIKTKMPLSEKSQLAKKLAIQLESSSQRKLINSTSNYEVEIRLIENKEGLYNTLIKLYTLEDKRFEYRKEAVATSIAPVRAALIARLAKEYLKEGAQVLDPFCGVGTMLIERNKCVPANPMYGIDHFGEAIDKAISNSRRDHTIINFINRDFFDFKHDYLFDEIFTNMPACVGRKSEDEIEMLYKQFFRKAKTFLKDEAVLVIYSRNKEYLLHCVQQDTAYHIEKEYVISKKEGAYLYIIRLKTSDI